MEFAAQKPFVAGVNAGVFISPSATMESVRFQVEYHFSDENLRMDNYLLSRMHEDPEYWVPVKIVANLTKIRSLTEDENVVLEVIRKSKSLILNEDETKVKRPNFIPPMPKQHKDLRRTAFLYGLKSDITRDEVEEMCCEFGKIKNIIFDDPSSFSSKGTSTSFTFKNNSNSEDENNNSDTMEPPNREVAMIIMNKRLGNKLTRHKLAYLHNNRSNGSLNSCSNTSYSPSISSTNCETLQSRSSNGYTNFVDFIHLRSCFVVFYSQSQANKLVKARARSQDGIRAMHQYDFIKECKNVAASKARGVLFSPESMTSNSSRSPSFSSLSPGIGGTNWSQKTIEKENNNTSNLQLPSSMLATNSFKQNGPTFVWNHQNSNGNNNSRNINHKNNNCNSRFPKPTQSSSHRYGNYVHRFSQNSNASPNNNIRFINRDNSNYDIRPSSAGQNKHFVFLNHNANTNTNSNTNTNNTSNNVIHNNNDNEKVKSARECNANYDNHFSTKSLSQTPNTVNTINAYLNHPLNIKQQQQQNLRNQCQNFYLDSNHPTFHRPKSVPETQYEKSNSRDISPLSNCFQCHQQVQVQVQPQPQPQLFSTFGENIQNNRNSKFIQNFIEDGRDINTGININLKENDMIMLSSELQLTLPIVPPPTPPFSPLSDIDEHIFLFDISSEQDVPYLAPTPTAFSHISNVMTSRNPNVNAIYQQY